MENTPQPLKASLPHQTGTYALIYFTVTQQTIAVGRLGLLHVQPGWWVYIGSAFGPGGIQGRVSRHLSAGPVRHWHIDYFKPAAVIKEVWYNTDSTRQEHEWARIFLGLPGAQIPLKRFGATDCSCPTHLIYFPSKPDDKAVIEAKRLQTAQGRSR